MSASAPMQFLYESGGRKWYFAKPGDFTRPGVWFWDGERNVHIDDALAESVSGAAPEPDEGCLSLEDAAEQHYLDSDLQPQILSKLDCFVEGATFAKRWLAPQTATGGALQAAPEPPDYGAIAWAVRKLTAFGIANNNNNMDNALMMDRLEFMLKFPDAIPGAAIGATPEPAKKPGGEGLSNGFVEALRRTYRAGLKDGRFSAPYGQDLETWLRPAEQEAVDAAITYLDSARLGVEPLGEVVGNHKVGRGEMPVIRWRDGYWPTVGTKLYAGPASIGVPSIGSSNPGTEGEELEGPLLAATSSYVRQGASVAGAAQGPAGLTDRESYTNAPDRLAETQRSSHAAGSDEKESGVGVPSLLSVGEKQAQGRSE